MAFACKIKVLIRLSKADLVVKAHFGADGELLGRIERNSPALEDSIAGGQALYSGQVRSS